MHVAGLIVENEGAVNLATIRSLFSDAQARYGKRIALTLGDDSMSYEELNAAAGRVAAGLRARGFGPGSLIGICLERGFAMVIAMLGVVMAGAAYLPLDTRYPLQRLQETVEDASPAMVIVEPGSALAGVCMSALESTAAATCEADPHVTPTDLLYVIYTSGSTGKPKGVEISHGNVAALLRGTEQLFRFTQNDVWTMFHSFAFDFSVWEMWGCLLTGGRLVIVPFAISRAPDDFWRLLHRERVTVLNQTPSAFALLDREDAIHAPGALALRVVIYGGEALAGIALRAWFDRHGDNQPHLVNMYGITETTVHVTYRRMQIVNVNECESLIGEAIPGWTIHLIEDEICVGGSGVARGYLGRPELTAERFVDGLYHSGDLAKRRPDGELVYLGRRDGQVKLNGFRIELGEVEAALLGCRGVEQACVIAREGRLVAYLVCREAPLAELKSKLPGHMLPSAYVTLQALPLTPNGKVDRNALPDPPATSPKGLATGSPMEQLVAGVWACVLGHEVATADNFFDIGGTSVLLIAVRAALQERLSRPIPVTWMFECTTIARLSSRLEEGLTAQSVATTTPAKIALVKTNAGRQRQAFARARTTRGVAR